MKLYTYDHCPFCTRARMIFGLKNQPLSNQFLLNDDEATPIGLIGKKMLPILIKADGSAMGESLDIVHYVDSISGDTPLAADVRPEISAWLARIGEYQYRLVWPRCIQIGLPEFATQAAIDYFVAKKSAVIGDFDHNFTQTHTLLPQLNADLAALAALVANTDNAIGEEDILLFPLLRNLSMVKGADWPSAVLNYMQRISQRSGVALFLDRAI